MFLNFSDGGRDVFHFPLPVLLVEMEVERPVPGAEGICRNEVVGHIGFGPSPRAHYTEVLGMLRDRLANGSLLWFAGLITDFAVRLF